MIYFTREFQKLIENFHYDHNALIKKVSKIRRATDIKLEMQLILKTEFKRIANLKQYTGFPQASIFVFYSFHFFKRIFL